jgi:putative transposase
MDWKHLLAYITGSVDQEILLRNEYLVVENRILRTQITGRVRLSDGERQTLAGIGIKLGKQALEEIATVVKPDTILAWHRKLIAKKFDGSQKRQSFSQPPLMQSWGLWSCAWLRKTAPGAMIVLLEL